MRVQSITRFNTDAKAPNANTTEIKTPTAFKSSRDEKILMQKMAFVSLDDSELKTLAYMASHENKNKTSPMTKALYALPIAEGVASSLLTKGSLAARMGAGLAGATTWALPLAVLGVFNKVEDVAVDNSSKLQNFRDKNPITYAVASAGLFLGTLALSIKGLNKGLTKLAEKAPNIFVKGDSLFTSIGKAIDNSIFNKKMMPKLRAASNWLGEKLPLVKSGLKTALNWSPWILIGSGFLANANNASKTSQKTADNYIKLKEAQLETTHELREIAQEINKPEAKTSKEEIEDED